MKVLNIMMLSLILSCGQLIQKDPRTAYRTDDEFLPYIQRFEVEWGSKIVDIPIVFWDLDEGIAGVCRIWNTGHREILIDHRYWRILPYSREQLIFHELGHCALGQMKHRNAYITQGCKESIMHDTIFSEDQMENCYYEEYSYYMDELFNF